MAVILMVDRTYAETTQDTDKEIILTVSGDVEGHLFDLADLEAMAQTTISTSTIWTEGVQEFQGVLLKTFLDSLEVTEGTLKVTAINDYAVEVPVSDAVENGPIIAYMHNGNYMPVRDKGPLWLVYPYDADPGYRAEMIYARSIWQLDRIEIQR
ncbi:molybdopterin-dependent oxidoreductase [Actibacterium lipolyticum]|nr:molybdopterin-dependent oxidoreductase [Actibacterium lipolyticum]